MAGVLATVDKESIGLLWPLARGTTWREKKSRKLKPEICIYIVCYLKQNLSKKTVFKNGSHVKSAFSVL